MRLFFSLLLLSFLIAPPAHAVSDVTRWLALRAENPPFEFSPYAEFLQRHPDWPEHVLFQSRAESGLENAGLCAHQMMQYFDRFAPVTDQGRLLYIAALLQNDQGKRAGDVLRDAWRRGNFSGDQQDMILSQYRAALNNDDHIARADALLWQSNLDRAARALTYISGPQRHIDETRIDLQRGRGTAPAEAESLLNSATNDGGLYFDLVRYYRQKDQDAAAISVLQRYRGPLDGHEAQWWRERAILARRALEDGNFSAAYKLAANHHLQSKAEKAEGEFFAGWLALTRLNRPDQAYRHFDAMYAVVQTPISIARAAYWAGVAASDIHQDQTATQWYNIAARHMNTFYGQMAAYATNSYKRAFADFFMRSQHAPAAQHLRSDLVSAARELQRQDLQRERDEFLTVILNDAKEKKIPQNVIALARELHAPKFALLAAKAAYEQGLLIKDALFPVLSVPRDPIVEKPLALAIIRQESQFDPMAVSPANARGLMQLMPATAEHTARQCGVPYKNAAQLFMPSHNMTLGQAYLGRLLQRYDDNVPLSVAAYNAGPRNVDEWVTTLGDPRRDEAAWIDWVERIPFYETRNYVQRVWENYSVYKALLQQ